MYFPWVGLLEQIKLCDYFLHYDDVLFSRGFINRVQIKTSLGMKWLTVPLKNKSQNRKINELLIDNSQNWQSEHLHILKTAYHGAPFEKEMLSIVKEVFSNNYVYLTDLNQSTLRVLTQYFELGASTKFKDIKNLFSDKTGSLRLLKICEKFHAHKYITGHGAKNYLDVSMFEKRGICVEIMDYKLLKYPQLHGTFTPYVSALDLAANCGKAGRDIIKSKAISMLKYNND